jgi:hypothetical protein
MSQIKPFLGIGFLIVILYASYMLVPPFYHNYVFQDWVDQKAKESTYAYNKNEDTIKQEVFHEAQLEEIPVNLDQIQVNKTGMSCSIAVTYDVHVDLPVFPQDFHFTAASQNSNIVAR